MKLVKSLSMAFNLKSKPSFRLPLINYLYAANCLISSNFSTKRINRPKPTKIHSWQMIPISNRSYVNKMRTYEQIFGVWGHFTKVLLIKSWGKLVYYTLSDILAGLGSQCSRLNCYSNFFHFQGLIYNV